MTERPSSEGAAPRQDLPIGRGGLALLAVTGLALGLRMAAAGGSLGLDEVWSLRLAGTLPGPGDAFWGLAHDNNHPLNTATMVLLGPDRPAWTYRAPAVALGAATVPTMAWALRRAGAAAAGLGGLFAAVCLPFVDFGSEARGYAGLTLATVLAIGLWQRLVAPPVPQAAAVRERWALAAVAAFGMLSHPGFGLSLGVLGLATLLHVGWRERRPGPAIAAALRLFGPTLAGLAPVGLAFGVAAWRHGGVTVGDVDPFSAGKLLAGMGDMLSLLLGLPASPTSPLVALLVVAALVAAARRGLIGPATQALAAAALPLLLVLLLTMRLPNTGYARYFAVCAIVAAMAGAEAAGGLWARGGHARVFVLAGTVLVACASLRLDAAAIRQGRSGAGASLALMRAEGGARYAATRPAMAAMLFGAAREGGAAPVATVPSCGAVPDWVVAVGTLDLRPDGTLTMGEAPCDHLYRARAPFASNPLSGTQWTLYRRAS